MAGERGVAAPPRPGARLISLGHPGGQPWAVARTGLGPGGAPRTVLPAAEDMALMLEPTILFRIRGLRPLFLEESHAQCVGGAWGSPEVRPSNSRVYDSNQGRRVVCKVVAWGVCVGGGGGTWVVPTPETAPVDARLLARLRHGSDLTGGRRGWRETFLKTFKLASLGRGRFPPRPLV